MKSKGMDLYKNKSFFDESETNHLILNLSLPLEERLKKAVTMPSAKATADYLKCGLDTVFNNRVAGKRIKSNVDGKLYAVRIVKKQISKNQ